MGRAGDHGAMVEKSSGVTGKRHDITMSKRVFSSGKHVKYHPISSLVKL